MIKLVAPGPLVATVTPTYLFIFHATSAAIAAACSCCIGMYLNEGFLEIASTIKAQAPPVTKKMFLQSCFSKKAAMYSAPVTRIL